MHVARLTIELLRPVPIQPLTARTRVLRPGRKVQLVEAALWHESTEVARCTALRLRRAEVPMPADLPRVAPPPAPQGGRDSLPPWSDAAGGSRLPQRRGRAPLRGAAASPPRGRRSTGFACACRCCSARPTTPLSRVAAAADFGNGVSWVLESPRRLPLHQSRPDRLPAPLSGRGMDLPRCRHLPTGERHRSGRELAVRRGRPHRARRAEPADRARLAPMPVSRAVSGAPKGRSFTS